MKCLKALGLVAVAAMALTAFLGAGSASASVYCTTTSTPCGASWHVDHAIFTAVASIGNHSTGGALEATCTGSSVTVNKTNTGSSTETATGSVAAAEMTWSGCNQTTDTLAGGELEVHQISGTDNGTVTGKGFEVTTNIAGVSCVFTFGTGTDLGVITGGHDAIWHLNAIVTKKSGSFLCPSDSVWEATFTLTNHTSLYIETN